MKLVTFNIRFGLGLDQRIDLERIASTVQDADIIALQEVERFWQRSGMVDQPERLGQILKKFHWVYYPAFDMDASEYQDDGSVHNRRRQFGPMVLSRWPIRASRLIVLPKLGTIDVFNMDLGVIECVIDTPSGYLRVYCVHLSAVSARERLIQIDQLLDFHRNAQMNGGAWTGDGKISNQDWTNGEALSPMPQEAVVMGDFNCEPESDEYNRMVGTKDLCNGRVGHQDGFVDSWTVARERSGDRISWFPDPPERAPGYGLNLDYCFITPQLAQRIERVWVDQHDDGSDHRPYWVVLDF